MRPRLSLERALRPADAGLCWLLMGAAAACGDTEAPSFAGTPPPEAAADALCGEPGFAQEVGEDRYRFVDMDQGESCVVFLEQDACVLAIFDDCTDATESPREWQGRATEDRMVTLSPVYAQAISGVRIPRSPACCVGPVPPAGRVEWLQLDCRLNSCVSRNRAHTGVFMIRDVEQRPPWTIETTETLVAPAAEERAVSAVWDDRRSEGWVGWAGGGLFVRDADGPAEVVAGVSSAGFVVQDDEAVFVANERELVRFDKPTRAVSRREALPGRALALVRVDEGVLVATDDDGDSQLALHDSDSLQLVATATHAGQINGLATRPAQGLAVATRDRVPQILFIGERLSAIATLDTATIQELQVDRIAPFAPRLLTPDRLAFLGPCYRTASKTHCYFEHSIAGPGRSERIGVPDEERLLTLHVATDSIWLGGVDNQIHRLNRDPFRPSPGEVTRLETDVAALIGADEALWVVSAREGQLTVLAPPK